MRLFIGNIPLAYGEMELRQWLEGLGHSVTATEVVRDRLTGNSRGFGFVEIDGPSDLQAMLKRLSGQRLAGRVLTIGPATPRFRMTPGHA
ncbi:MAG TPA: RNA-binding protein [Terriglobia bacterium]|nr:RNA-binding protein [Terriglobia bacterium]